MGDQTICTETKLAATDGYKVQFRYITSFSQKRPAPRTESEKPGTGTQPPARSS